MNSCISYRIVVDPPPPSPPAHLVVAKALAIRNGGQAPSNVLIAMIRHAIWIDGALFGEGGISLTAAMENAGQSKSKSTGAHLELSQQSEQTLLTPAAKLSEPAGSGNVTHASGEAVASAV